MTIEDINYQLSNLREDVEYLLGRTEQSDIYLKALDMAMSALRVQQEAEKNEPLTLKEMRKMDGEPVYVVPQNGGYVAGATNWAKVNAKCERCEASNLNFYFCEYVTYWLAYRHPPKEVHDV